MRKIIKIEAIIKNHSDIALQEDDFIDVKLEKGKLVFFKKDVIICTIDAEKYKKIFKRRKKLKAVVKEFIDENIKVQIIRFADLHRHSGYSLLDGAIRIKDMVEKTEYAGGLTDHGIMSGILAYYKEMIKQGKKPIIGFEAYTESIDGKKEAYHLLLLAKNEVGFKNLIKLTSLGYHNYYYKPQVSYDMLRKHSEGIIATSACLGGEIAKNIANNDYKKAKKVAKELANIFGKEDFYIEIQRHNISQEKVVNPQLIKLAKELDLKLVATTDSHYTNKEDSYEHEVLLCIGTGKTMNDEKRFRFGGTGYHIHSPEEVEELFADIPEALDNTLEIAEKCNLKLDLNQVHMPEFKVPSKFKGDAEYFEHLCWEGFAERFKGTEKFNDEEYKERLQFEIDTITNMGFASYFLIVWDFVKFAKDNGILVGPGRGSACGSLVAYVLRITEVDPIPYGLLFERFLNPDRVSMPDIDLDFADTRREEVIDYVKEKYGIDAVSRIITFGTLSARSVIRDVTRVLDKPYSLGDKIAKAIPATPKITLKKALEESVEFSNMYNTNPEVKEIVNIAMKLEGLPRNMSQHACGVIIAKSAVDNYIPQVLMLNEDTGIKEPTTQFTMSECEEMGLLKMDFLGLRTMGVVDSALKDINAKRKSLGQKPIDFLSIPTNDLAVYDFIAQGNTEGVFQLESAGMTAFMKELFQDAHTYLNIKDENKRNEIGTQLFERLIAGISLYRPGPIDEIPNYIKNMLSPEYIQYDTPELEPILKNTYGIIVYQEQCMFIVRELAGFTKGMADNVRKAMAKKKEEMLGPLGEQFIHGKTDKDGNVVIDGCLRRGISLEIATRIWDKMKKFGEYAFNKSHAGGYAEIAIRTAWLSYYYPVEYMTATLNSFISKADKIKLYMAVCKKKGINVLPPDVNKSREVFTVDEDAIRFGLMGIKGLGKSSIDIIKERDARGEFKSFQDFAERMAIHYKIDRRILEGLVYSGAVDYFIGTRNAKLSMLDKILSSASIEKKNAQTGQIDIFSLSPEFKKYKVIETPKIEEFDKKFKLMKEKEFAGFYITEHPLDEYIKYFKGEGVLDIGFLQENMEKDAENEEDEELGLVQYSDYNGQVIKVAGIIKELHIFYTKKDQKPLYVFQVEDKTGEIKCVVFADRLELCQDKLIENKVVIIQGQLKQDDFGTQIIVRNIYDIEALSKSEKPKAVCINIFDKSKINELVKLVDSNQGNIPVLFKYNGKKYKTRNNINLTFATFSWLQDVFGSNVKVFYN